MRLPSLVLTLGDSWLENKCLQAIIGMFFQDGLTGSAWGDWAGMPCDFEPFLRGPLHGFSIAVKGKLMLCRSSLHWSGPRDVEVPRIIKL